MMSSAVCRAPSDWYLGFDRGLPQLAAAFDLPAVSRLYEERWPGRAQAGLRVRARKVHDVEYQPSARCVVTHELTLKRGGRLVTCGSTSGQSTQINLFQLYLQQYRIFGSFGASIRNVRESLAKMAAGLTPVIDTEVPLAEFESGLARLEDRKVFGKIIVTF